MITLRPYQVEAVDSIYNFFQTHPVGNPVVALPTGTGKSIIPADFIKRVMEHWPSQRFMVLTHVKKLIEQNADKLRTHWPLAPLGIYSDGLKQKDTWAPITFGGVGSVVNALAAFGIINILFIDECHLVSDRDNSQYQKVIAGLKQANPRLRVVGLSATPYRMGSGLLTDGSIFTHFCYDRTKTEDFEYFINNGYLSPLIARPTEFEFDASSIRITGGDYNISQQEDQLEEHGRLSSALDEFIRYGSNRRSWLIFAPGIKTADRIAEMLRVKGINALSLHSKSPNPDARLESYLSHGVRCLVTNNMVTTGVDHPSLDLIGIFRMTRSVPLWVQMLGRGTRVCDGKTNCLVLDYARNTPRLGPIDAPRLPIKREKKDGEMPVKICDQCGFYNHARAVVCEQCGTTFPAPVENIRQEADDTPVMSVTPDIREFNVDYAIYSPHVSKKGNECIRANYYCGRKFFKSYHVLTGPAYFVKKGRDWWSRHHPSSPPANLQEAMPYLDKLATPSTIKVWTNAANGPEILDYRY